MITIFYRLLCMFVYGPAHNTHSWLFLGYNLLNYDRQDNVAQRNYMYHSVQETRMPYSNSPVYRLDLYSNG